MLHLSFAGLWIHVGNAPRVSCISLCTISQDVISKCLFCHDSMHGDVLIYICYVWLGLYGLWDGLLSCLFFLLFSQFTSSHAVFVCYLHSHAVFLGALHDMCVSWVQLLFCLWHSLASDGSVCWAHFLSGLVLLGVLSRLVAATGRALIQGPPRSPFGSFFLMCVSGRSLTKKI